MADLQSQHAAFLDMVEALEAAHQHLGLAHVSDEDLKTGIDSGFDGPKGLTKGSAALTLQIRAALAKARGE